MLNKNLFTFLALISLFTSCQKVIDIDLNDANPQYVIEGAIYEGVNDFKVHITQTSSYFGNDAPSPVNNAVVTLNDPNSSVITLNPTGNGWYEIAAFMGKPNSLYELNVQVGGQSFTANATMPNHAAIDTFSVKEFGGFGPPDPEQGDQLLLVHFKDSAGIKNYYRVVVKQNNKLLEKPEYYYIFDDQIRDGLAIEAPLFTSLFFKGDSVDVELLGMDAGVYDYFTTLRDVLSGDANTGAAPANPNSNFNNGALGYFAAYSSSKKSIRIL